MPNSVLRGYPRAGDILDGETNVAVIGTPVPLGVGGCSRVFVQAESTNTGSILVGDSTPVFTLSAGESIEINVNSLSKVYVDATVVGEGVVWLAEV